MKRITNTVILKLTVLLIISCIHVSAQTFDHAYTDYESFLKRHVEDGLVNYRAIVDDPAKLGLIVDQIADVSPDEFEAFNRSQQLAFYINAYNLLTIKAIVDHYPVESIKDIDGVWDELTFGVAGRRLTLDNIEHDILRTEFDEPRIHVAVVCASLSCPALPDYPFEADSIDDQLTRRSEVFVRDSTRNRWLPFESELRLSKIFDWYGQDFEATYLPDNPFPHLDGRDAATAHFYFIHATRVDGIEMQKSHFDVSHLDYDWSLNEQK